MRFELVAFGLAAFWLGGTTAILGGIVSTWNDPPRSVAEQEAASKLPPVVSFVVVTILALIWPGLVVYLFARSKDDR